MAQREADVGALYLAHKDAMHRVASNVLRRAGREADALDVVHDVITSLMRSRPARVDSWENYLVRATRYKAIDMLRSAAVRHAGPELRPEHDHAADEDMAEGVADAVDAQRRAHLIREKVSELEPKLQKVAREYIGKRRSRQEVAAELGVSPSRVSQLAKQALEQMKEKTTWEEVF